MRKKISANSRWLRILPVTFLMYTIAMMDRNNIGFAFSGMEKDLGIGATYAGLAGGIFFIGYLFLQIPGGLLAQKWSAKKLITIAIVFWGVFSVLSGFITNIHQLLIIRFLIGFAEGCVAPCVVVMLSKWFPLNERARANSFWMMSVPFSALIMSPLCGYLLTVADWRTMFIIQGIPAFFMAALWWYFIEDGPSKAKWISKEERDYLETVLSEEKKGMHVQAVSVKDALKNRNVLLLVLVWFLIQLGNAGFTIWLPSVVKTISGGDQMTVGLISSLPWLAAIVGIIINSRHSDKTGERKMHVAVSVIIGAILLLVSALIGQEHPVQAIVFLVLSTGFMQSFNGIWWTIPSTFLKDEVLGVSLGLINAIGNLGGFFGPFIVGLLISLTHSFLAGMVFLVVMLILSGILIMKVNYEKPTVGKKFFNENEDVVNS